MISPLLGTLSSPKVSLKLILLILNLFARAKNLGYVSFLVPGGEMGFATELVLKKLN